MSEAVTVAATTRRTNRAAFNSTAPLWLRGVVLVVSVLIVQAPSLRGAFVWDDVSMIAENPRLETWQGLADFWTSVDQPDYWPVAYSSHWLEHKVWGDWATGYRGLNLLLHAANVLLLWRVLTQFSVPGAWWAALAFALHPVTVEATAWILQRKTLLATTGAFASLALLVDNKRRGSGMRYVASIACFTLGLLAKSSIVMWPLILAAAVAWPDGQWRRALRLTLPYFAIAAVLGVVGVWFQTQNAIGETIVRNDDTWSRLALAGRCVWFYAAQFVWPTNLSFVYPRWTADTSSFTAWLPDFALAAAFLIAWLGRRRWSSGPLLAAGYFVINLVPALGLVNIYFMRYSLVADHWQYLAMPGLLALAAATAATWIERGRPGLRIAIVGIGAAWLIMAAAVSWQRSVVFGHPTNEPLYRDTIAKNDSAWLAHNNLGLLLAERGERNEAATHYRRALELNPNYADAANNLGLAERAAGDLDSAAAQFLRATQLEPDHARAWANLGGVYLAKNVPAEAIAALERSVSIAPRYAAAHLQLGLALDGQGETGQAIAQLQRAIELSKQPAQPHAALGRLLAGQGKLQAAAEHLSEVIRIQPEYTQAYLDLGTVQASLGDRAAAVATYEALLERDPRSAAAHQALGELQAAARAWPEAIDHLWLAWAIDAGSPEAAERLATAYDEGGWKQLAGQAYALASQLWEQGGNEPAAEVAKRKCEEAIGSVTAPAERPGEQLPSEQPPGELSPSKAP